jgi:hypothetical protein
MIARLFFDEEALAAALIETPYLSASRYFNERRVDTANVH